MNYRYFQCINLTGMVWVNGAYLKGDEISSNSVLRNSISPILDGSSMIVTIAFIGGNTVKFQSNLETLVSDF